MAMVRYGFKASAATKVLAHMKALDIPTPEPEPGAKTPEQLAADAVDPKDGMTWRERMKGVADMLNNAGGIRDEITRQERRQVMRQIAQAESTIAKSKEREERRLARKSARRKGKL